MISLKKEKWKRLLKLITAGAVILYLSLNIDFHSVYLSAIKADFILLSAVLLLLPLNIFFQYLKWKESSSYFLNLKDRLTIINSLFAGFSAAVFTPARVGEYFGRTVGLGNYDKLKITTAVFFDKLYTLTWVFVSGIICLYLIYTQLAQLVIISVAVLCTVFVVIKMSGFSLSIIFRKIKFLNGFIEKIKNINFPDTRYNGRMLFFSLLFYTIFLVQFALLIAAFSESNHKAVYLPVAGATMFVKTVVPNFFSGEIGIRESAAVFFMTHTGENAAAGFNASVFLFLINIALPSAIGLIPLVRSNK